MRQAHVGPWPPLRAMRLDKYNAFNYLRYHELSPSNDACLLSRIRLFYVMISETQA